MLGVNTVRLDLPQYKKNSNHSEVNYQTLKYINPFNNPHYPVKKSILHNGYMPERPNNVVVLQNNRENRPLVISANQRNRPIITRSEPKELTTNQKYLLYKLGIGKNPEQEYLENNPQFFEDYNDGYFNDVSPKSYSKEKQILAKLYRRFGSEGVYPNLTDPEEAKRYFPELFKSEPFPDREHFKHEGINSYSFDEYNKRRQEYNHAVDLLNVAYNNVMNTRKKINAYKQLSKEYPEESTDYYNSESPYMIPYPDDAKHREFERKMFNAAVDIDRTNRPTTGVHLFRNDLIRPKNK